MNNNEVIYSERIRIYSFHYVITMILVIVQFIAITSLFCLIAKNIWINILIILIALFLFSVLIKKETHKIIYCDRIELRKTFGNQELIESIKISDFYQARYEDLFGKEPFRNTLNHELIYFYAKKNVNSENLIKKDKLILSINKDRNTEKNLIEIIKLAQKKNLEVYVSTKKYKRILKDLNLKNWTLP